MKFKILFMTWILGLMPVCAALSPEQQAIVQSVQTSLNNLKSLKAKINQTNPDGTTATGMILLKRHPGNLRLTYEGERPIRIFANGEQLVYEEDGQVSTYYTDTTPVNFLIQDQIDLQRDLRVLGVKQEKPYVIVTVSRPGEESVMFISLVFTDTLNPQLVGWSVSDAQSKLTHVKLENIETDIPLDLKLFQWTPR